MSAVWLRLGWSCRYQYMVRESLAPRTLQVAPNSRAIGWLKRLGFGGFMFFLIKGLLWLAIPALLAWLGR